MPYDLMTLWKNYALFAVRKKNQESLITYKIPHINTKHGRDSWNEEHGEGKDDNRKELFSYVKSGVLMAFLKDCPIQILLRN